MVSGRLLPEFGSPKGVATVADHDSPPFRRTSFATALQDSSWLWQSGGPES